MQDLIKKHPIELAIAAAILIFCFGFYWSTFANALHTPIDDVGNKQTFGSGTFGDAFGAVNALFTGLALLGLAISILLQRLELSIVKSERRDTQETLEIQRQINEKMEDDLIKRRLEDRFFELYERINSEFWTRLHERVGRDFIEGHFIELMNKCDVLKLVNGKTVSHFLQDSSGNPLAAANSHFLAFKQAFSLVEIAYEAVLEIEGRNEKKDGPLMHLLASCLGRQERVVIAGMCMSDISSDHRDMFRDLRLMTALRGKISEDRINKFFLETT